MTKRRKIVWNGILILIGIGMTIFVWYDIFINKEVINGVI